MPVPFPVLPKLICNFFSHQKAVCEISHLLASYQDFLFLNPYLMLIVVIMLWVLTALACFSKSIPHCSLSVSGVNPKYYLVPINN